MTRWLFDLGNTRLKAAPLDTDGRVGDVVTLTHREGDLGELLRQHLPAEIEAAYVASVAAEGLRIILMRALATRCRRISVARTTRRWERLRIAYPEPARLGVDRFLALLGQHARGEGAALVCGVGTALTIDLVDGEGRHLGGRIAPSPTLMREALHGRASQLPASGGRYLEFANDTADALASGCDGAAIALVEHSLAAAAQELGVAPRLVLHGGGAAALAPELPQPVLRPHLVLEGLAHWAMAACAP